MDDGFAAALAEYDRRRAAEDGDRTLPLDRRLLAVGPETGALLNLLAKGTGARRVLELGTSYGYSTLWFADAARATGGRVLTVELDPAKQDFARRMLERAGLRDVVEFHAGDALDVLPRLDGPFDFVLVDLWKDLYIPCLDLFYPKLAPGALIAADNMTEPRSNRANAAAYRHAVRAKPHITSLLLPVGHGIELSRFTGGLQAELR
ncbi:MAG TPA: O-methyltransferase [Hyphomicrobiales bacterium]|nr:O-methyltransferase [Hyphomicrobiales bacterium]